MAKIVVHHLVLLKHTESCVFDWTGVEPHQSLIAPSYLPELINWSSIKRRWCESAVRLFALKPCRRSDNSQPFLSLLGVSFIAHSSSWDWLAQNKNSDQHLGPGPAAWLKPEQREGGTGTYMYVCFLLYVGASFELWRLHPCTKTAQLAQVQPASCHTECFVIVQEEREPIRSGQAEDEKCHNYGFRRPPLLCVEINTFDLIMTAKAERCLS